VTGQAHSIVGGSAWEPTPWRAGAAGGVGDAADRAGGHEKLKLRRRRELSEASVKRSQATRAKRQLAVGVAAILLFALAAFGLLVWRESGRECVQFAQKLKPIDGATFWSPVCAEWRPRR
jgi:hypothetical protein